MASLGLWETRRLHWPIIMVPFCRIILCLSPCSLTDPDISSCPQTTGLGTWEGLSSNYSRQKQPTCLQMHLACTNHFTEQIDSFTFLRGNSGAWGLASSPMKSCCSESWQEMTVSMACGKEPRLGTSRPPARARILPRTTRVTFPVADRLLLDPQAAVKDATGAGVGGGWTF